MIRLMLDTLAYYWTLYAILLGKLRVLWKARKWLPVTMTAYDPTDAIKRSPYREEWEKMERRQAALDRIFEDAHHRS